MIDTIEPTEPAPRVLRGLQDEYQTGTLDELGWARTPDMDRLLKKNAGCPTWRRPDGINFYLPKGTTGRTRITMQKLVLLGGAVDWVIIDPKGAGSHYPFTKRASAAEEE